MNALLADLRLKYEPAERISASEALFLPQATGTENNEPMRFAEKTASDCGTQVPSLHFERLDRNSEI